MVTVNRRGKSKTAALISTVAAMGKENYDSAYAMWKMGAPAKELAEQHGVPEMNLEYSFELRLIIESKE
jgi:protein involved in ribonucleotide reduction